MRGFTSEQVGDLAAAHGIVLHELTPKLQSLESLYLDLLGAKTE